MIDTSKVVAARTPRPTPKTVARIKAIHADIWRWHGGREIDSSSWSGCCRFCGVDAFVARMLKYGVRHYACDDCVAKILKAAP